MKLISNILLVLCFVMAVLVAMHIAGVAGNAIYWDRVAGVEEASIPEAAKLYNDARSRLAAISADERQRRSGIEIDAAVRANEHSILRLYADEAAAAEKEITDRRASLDASVEGAKRTPGLFVAVQKQLSDALATRAADRDRAVEMDQNLQRDVAAARKAHARAKVQYDDLEMNLSIMGAELARRQEKIATYRYLRPNLQEELGDNGMHVAGEVTAATGQSVTINRGAKDGVQLYQKYSIMRGDSVVAVANVVSVSNGTAELEIVTMTMRDRGVTPRAGDIAVVRQLMLASGASLGTGK